MNDLTLLRYSLGITYLHDERLVALYVEHVGHDRASGIVQLWLLGLMEFCGYRRQLSGH